MPKLVLLVTVVVGPYVFSVSETPEGETRIGRAIDVDGVQKGTSYCVAECLPASKPEKVESVDLGGDGLVAASLNRTDGKVTTDVGLQKSFSAFDGKLALTFSATTSFVGAKIVDSWPIRAVLPSEARRKAKSWLGEGKAIPTIPTPTKNIAPFNHWREFHANGSPIDQKLLLGQRSLLKNNSRLKHDTIIRRENELPLGRYT